jgi:hypothetical protein
MSTFGLGLGSPGNGQDSGTSSYGTSSPVTSTDHALIAQRLQAESSLKSGAGWFIWIAGLSVVNTISAYTGSSWGFAAGLGITQVVDYAAKGLGTAGLLVGMLINVMAVGFFVLMFVFGRKAQKWAFVTGLIFYGLDTLLVLALGIWFGLAIHALGLWGMVRGLRASSELARLAEAEQRRATGATAAHIG